MHTVNIWQRAIRALTQEEGTMHPQLGDKVRDRMTGFGGIVVARTEWLYNCTRSTVQPTTLKDGQPQETHTFDEPQLEMVKVGAFQTHVDAPAPPTKTGGPRSEPTQRATPPQR